jgi:hypothetical protein
MSVVGNAAPELSQYLRILNLSAGHPAGTIASGDTVPATFLCSGGKQSFGPFVWLLDRLAERQCRSTAK